MKTTCSDKNIPTLFIENCHILITVQLLLQLEAAAAWTIL
jgi:hypothetical protein